MVGRDPSQHLSRCRTLQRIFEETLGEIRFLEDTVRRVIAEWRNVTNSRLATDDPTENARLAQEQHELIAQRDRLQHQIRQLGARLQDIRNEFEFEDREVVLGSLR